MILSPEKFHIVLKKSLIMTVSALAFPAFAQSSGYVGRVDVVPGVGNYETRVYLQTQEVLCNGKNWAGLHSDNPNYQGITATLLTAKVTGSAITLYTRVESSGWCSITHLTLQ